MTILKGAEGEIVNQTSQYPIPLYLNQKYVFDILAMMEGGFSQLETIKTTQTEQEDKSRRYSGEVGFKNVFAFLGVSLGTEKTAKGQTGESQEVTKEKVHTPNSLFAQMRKRLHEQKLIVSSKLSETKPGNFVEFNITLRKNPLIDAIESLKSIMQTASIFVEPQQKSKGQRPSENVNKKILEQMDALLNQLNAEGTLDLIGTSVGEERIKVVLTIDRAFLSDPSLSDLISGEYTVLGKVTKVIPQSGEDKVNLLRKTSLGKIQGQLLEQLKKPLKDLQQSDFKIPELITEIEGPAIQVIPIAVFA